MLKWYFSTAITLLFCSPSSSHTTFMDTFVKASKTHMLHKLSTVTLITSVIRASGSWSKFLCQKMKASQSFHVTLANASGVSKYHTTSLIASILSYLKIVQYAQPADSPALKGLGRCIFNPP